MRMITVSVDDAVIDKILPKLSERGLTLEEAFYEFLDDSYHDEVDECPLCAKYKTNKHDDFANFNQETIQAIINTENGIGLTSYDSVDDLFKEFGL